MTARKMSRRVFLEASATAITASAMPLIVSSRIFGKTAPSNTLQIGCIGTGRMGHGDMGECLRRGLDPSAHARIIAVCDLDRHRREHARAECEKFYVAELSGATGPAIRMYEDYRELLARDDIDGVTISVPDFWHALVATAAANAGKDIYVQKPLTYTIGEGQQLVEAVRRNQVVLQTGSQQRSDKRFRQACELVRNGRLGNLRSIRVVIPIDSGTGNATPMPVPPNLNYDMWLGPTPVAPYTEDRVHPQGSISGRPGWLQVERYCLGMITGWGSHMFDIAQWGHGSDHSGPVEMEATGEFPDRGLFDVHTTFKASGRYADGVQLLAGSGDPAGVIFEGDEGAISVGRGYLNASHPALLKPLPDGSETQLYISDNHMQNYLECMRSRQDPVCPVEVGHRSNSICVMTHLAMKLGRKLAWNPQAERFVDDEEANARIDYRHREPWQL